MATSNITTGSYSAAELSVTLFEEAGDALFLFDPDSEQLLDVNPMAQRLSGFSRAELLRMAVTYLFRSEVQGGLNRLRHAYKKTGIFHSQEGFLLRHQRGGVWIPVNLTVTRLHAEPKTLGLVTARDVREQRELFCQFKKAEAELRSVLSAVSDCIWSAEVDPHGNWDYRMFSPVVEKITGRPAEFYLEGPEQWLGTIHPDDQPRVRAARARIIAGQAAAEEEYRVVWPNGTVRWLRDSVRVNAVADSSKRRIDGVVTDITERKQAELALRANEELFRALVEKGSDAVALLNTDGTIVYASPSTTHVMGYRLEEFVGRNAFDFLHAGDLARIRTLVEQLQGEAGKEITTHLRCRHKDASYRHLEATAGNRLNDPSVRALVINFRDITERKRAEEELRLLQNVILAVSAAGDLTSALGVALREICQATGWVFAQAWIPHPELGVLECSPAWYCSAGGLEEFRVQCLSQLLPPGVGLAGIAWTSKRSTWLPDISLSDNFPNAAEARKAGLIAGLAIPP